MNLYLQTNHLIIVVFTLFFFSCNNDKTVNNAQSRTLYNVIFRDTTTYFDGTVKTLVAYNITDGVTVMYSDNGLTEVGTKTVIATFTLKNAEDWWSFGDIKEYYYNNRNKPKETEAQKIWYDAMKILANEDSINVRIDTRWRKPMTDTAILKVVNGSTQNTTDPKFFNVATKVWKNGKTELEIVSYAGSEKNIVIPAYINNKAIRRIGENAFKNSTITSIVFPESDSLHYISKNAFRGCASLTKITLCKSIDSIAASAFMGVAADSITLWGDVKYIGEDAFGQTKLKRVRVYATTPPQTEEYIIDPTPPVPTPPSEGYIFAGSTMLKEIFIPSGTLGTYKAAIGWAESEFTDALKEM